MYFKSRVDAGVRLAEQLMQYRYENTVVVALDRGGVRIGYQIAANLHCTLNELLCEPIMIEGENLQYATVMQGGVVAKNPSLSEEQQDFYYGEFLGQINDATREATTRINRMLGDGGDLDPKILRDHIVILVSDGMENGSVLEAAVEFLKPIRVAKVVVTTPIASVEAVDKMHILADELHVLGVTPNYINTAHYYETDDMPTGDETKMLINHTILGWQ